MHLSASYDFNLCTVRLKQFLLNVTLNTFFINNNNNNNHTFNTNDDNMPVANPTKDEDQLSVGMSFTAKLIS